MTDTSPEALRRFAAYIATDASRAVFAKLAAARDNLDAAYDNLGAALADSKATYAAAVAASKFEEPQP